MSPPKVMTVPKPAVTGSSHERVRISTRDGHAGPGRSTPTRAVSGRTANGHTKAPSSTAAEPSRDSSRIDTWIPKSSSSEGVDAGVKTSITTSPAATGPNQASAARTPVGPPSRDVQESKSQTSFPRGERSARTYTTSATWSRPLPA